MGSTGATGSKSRSRGASSSPSPVSLSSVKVQNGNIVTLDKPLQYGVNDPSIPDAVRKVMEPWELIREKSYNEHVLFLDDKGNKIYEKRGQHNKVNIQMTLAQTFKVTVMTHNHPRTDNSLGGTFSPQDINTFNTLRNLKTIRATSTEGTYTMTKGKNYDGKGLLKAINKLDRDLQIKAGSKRAAANRAFSQGKITKVQRDQQVDDIFNGYLVRYHNGIADLQSKYDFKYTLEKKGGT